MRLTDTATVTISVRGIELIALQKLALVSHVLAKRLDRGAGDELRTLATTLDDLLRRIQIEAATGKGGK